MHSRRSSLVLLSLLVLVSAVSPIRAETMVALMTDKKLRYFSSSEPANDWIKTVAISGIPREQAVVALEFRPDGSLVVISRELSVLRAYEINPQTGAVIGKASEFEMESAFATGFNAFPAGVHSHDLVLTTEADVMIRFTSGSGSGTLPPLTLAYDNSATDRDPIDAKSGADPSIVALAGTNSFTGAGSSVLYGIDSVQSTLVKIDWSTGSIDTVATLELPEGTKLGFDPRVALEISGSTGVAYLMFGSGGVRNLYGVDLTTGATQNLGTIGPTDDEIGVTVQDIAALPPSELANISTRSRVGTGEDVMIAGFIVTGGDASRMVIRGLGPSLANAGVAGVLADPTLTIFDGNGAEVASNDNWRSSQQFDLGETQLAPSNDLEAAYVGMFAPGAYTARVAGKNGGTGVGLVEVYRLE